MSFGILQTFIKRAKALGVIEKAEHETILRQFQVKKDQYNQNLIEIVEEERPPMIEIDEYRKKFKK